ncbi:hypothetical protein C2845_PM10G07310 [Panicum miliaceum]|uniref:DUF1618 domain-containing protein n=1 Tax=Panicum miliaceum TaxID=4540 RepID=A0A3L6PFU6_PANMI|nr:hypothetical protein C2845_PM10G07310 [Panicum miliaceum]
MSKRKVSDDRRGDCAGKRPKQAKQHLYLLLDDWERGYSVRKLDVDTFDSDAGTDLLQPRHFTEPPVARIDALHEISCSFISHGTKIFAMQPGEGKPAIAAFDTHALGLTICLWPSCRGDYVNRPLFASVAGRLFLFTDVLAEALGDPPPYDSKAPWSWTTIKARPPFFTGRVLCHALHPDGRTLFVSTGSRSRQRNCEDSPEQAGQGTFSFDAERLRWRHHGDWVGLCGERNGDGCFCACDVAPVAAEFTSAPAWKLGQDRLFRKGPQLHLGAKLLYMGDSKFCLVESVLHKEDDDRLVA